jgi:hypothetical protein
MDAEPEIDARPEVIAYLERRKCADCRSPLSSIVVADITRSLHSPVFRCWPPHPTCWQFRCPGCGQDIVVASRKGKCWSITGELTRRSPRPRAGTTPDRDT